MSFVNSFVNNILLINYVFCNLFYPVHTITFKLFYIKAKLACNLENRINDLTCLIEAEIDLASCEVII